MFAIEDEKMWSKPVLLFDSFADLLGECLSRLGSGVKYDVTTLDVGSYVRQFERFEVLSKLRHRQDVVSAHIDAAK